MHDADIDLGGAAAAAAARHTTVDLATPLAGRRSVPKDSARAPSATGSASQGSRGSRKRNSLCGMKECAAA